MSATISNTIEPEHGERRALGDRSGGRGSGGRPAGGSGGAVGGHWVLAWLR